MTPSVCIVGSANLDIVVPVPHHPATGETVLGGDHSQIPGGKGANQAVAASRLGGAAIFVGRVGDDPAGDTLRQALVSSGVEVAQLSTTPSVPSGIALITVDEGGDNAIVVSPGANALVSPEDVAAASEALNATATLLQLEIPIDSVLAAARQAAGLVILDPAPAPAEGLPDELLAAVDIVVPNETELAILARRSVDSTDLEALESAARSLRTERVVVTLGSQGALVVDGESATHIPAPQVEVVDTTAAGDAFRAALAVELSSGASLVDAATLAVRVGAATTLSFGAQPSLPTRDEVARLLP